ADFGNFFSGQGGYPLTHRMVDGVHLPWVVEVRRVGVERCRDENPTPSVVLGWTEVDATKDEVAIEHCNVDNLSYVEVLVRFQKSHSGLPELTLAGGPATG